MSSVPLRVARLALLLAGLAACESPAATLHVDVQTDLVPELELGALEIEVVSEAGRVIAQAGPLAPDPADADDYLAAGVRVASFDRLPVGTYTVVVFGREAADAGLPLDGGAILVQTRVLVSLRAAAPRVVRVVLGARCAGLACPDGDDLELTACLNGRCVRPSCDVTMGEVCDDRAPCAAGDPAGCSRPPDCATVVCRGGACLNEPIIDSCGAGEYCGRRGCELVPGLLPPMPARRTRSWRSPTRTCSRCPMPRGHADRSTPRATTRIRALTPTGALRRGARAPR